MSLDWSERYRQGKTPWEKGQAHPELATLLEMHRDLVEAADHILVPGCGFGHDARLIDRYSKGTVTGLDIASEAIQQARILTEKPGPRWEVGDLFNWQGAYDLVFEHTCFCAIPVERRPEYVEAMARLIRPGGSLLGIFFLNPDHEGEAGPPFGVQREELDHFFGNFFEIRWSAAPRRTYPSRLGDGRELSLLLQRQA